jgi:hypothetical protein
MSISKLVVLALGLVLVSAGFGAALADWSSPEPGPAIDLVDADARKDDGSGDGLLVTEEETDEDETAGDPPAAGAPQAGLPLPPVPGAGGDEATGGDDGAPGGGQVEARLAPALPAPAGPGAAADDDQGGAGGGAGDNDDGDDDTD